MEQNQEYEQEIDLKDLLYVVLKRWRPVCLTAVLLGLVLGGYKLAGGMMDASSGAESAEAMSRYEAELDSYQTQKAASEKQLAVFEGLLKTETKRMETAPIMQLDPTTAVCLSYGMQVTVSTNGQNAILNGQDVVLSGGPGAESSGFGTEEADQDGGEKDRNYTYSVIDGYAARLSDVLMDEAAAQLGMEPADLAGITEIRGDLYSHRVYIDAYAATKEEAADILGVFTSLIGEEQDALSREFGDHTIAQVSERLSQDANGAVLDRQLEFLDGITELKTQISDTQTALEEMEGEKPAPPSTSQTEIVKNGVKFGAIGFILGGFLMVFFICVAYLMSDKLMKLKDATRRFGVKGLGEFAEAEPEKKRFLPGADRLIDRLFGHGRRLTADETYQIVAANVRNYMPEGAKKLLVTGSADGEKIGQIAAYLSETIKEASFEASPALAQDPATLSKLSGCDAVVLVEERGRSTAEDVDAELTVLRNVEKPVVGMVLC